MGGSTCCDNPQQVCWTVSDPPTRQNTTKSKRFLLAHLHLEHIALESTKADIRDSLENLTSNLTVEYDRNFERIVGSPARSKLALRVFSWLLAAQRPLNVEELREALAIGLEDSRLQKDRKPSKAIILDSCLGLIRLNNVSNTVEFFHFTAKEHILSRKEMQGCPLVGYTSKLPCIFKIQRISQLHVTTMSVLWNVGTNTHSAVTSASFGIIMYGELLKSN